MITFIRFQPARACIALAGLVIGNPSQDRAPAPLRGRIFLSVIYYFEKKDDIVNALGEALTALYQEKFQSFLDSREEGSGDNIEKMLHYLVEAFVFDRRLNRVFYNLVQMGFERRGVSVPLRRLLDAYRGNIGDMLVQSGAGEQSGPLSMMVVGVIEGLALQWMIDPDALDRQEVWDTAGRVREVIKSSFSAGPEDNQAVT